MGAGPQRFPGWTHHLLHTIRPPKFYKAGREPPLTCSRQVITPPTEARHLSKLAVSSRVGTGSGLRGCMRRAIRNRRWFPLHDGARLRAAQRWNHMGTPANATQIWRFGVFEVDALSGELRRNGSAIKLREQSSRI